MPVVRLSLAVAAVAVAACTPTLDWREVRPEGTGLVVLLPCKPATAARDVLLARRSVRLSLAACSAGGQTWAVGSADVGDPALVAAALDQLRRSAASNLSAPPPAGAPLAVRGATPNPASVRAAIEGRLPDGQPVREELALFARGTRVFQATVLGETLAADAVETFVGSLQLR